MSVVLAACLLRLAIGDGLIQEMPASKSWVRYRMSEEWSGRTTREINVAIRLVRREMHNSKPCSFVECRFSVSEDESVKRSYLFLVPDDQNMNHKYLENSPLVWSKIDGMYTRKDDPWDGFLPRLKLIFLPTDKKTRVSTNRTIQVENSSLECSVYAGTGSYKTNMEDVQINYEIAESSEIPFGVAELALTVELDVNGAPASETGKIRFRVLSFGENEFSETRK